eukprot:3491666-Prymnesium_polylepis.1
MSVRTRHCVPVGLRSAAMGDDKDAEQQPAYPRSGEIFEAILNEDESPYSLTVHCIREAACQLRGRQLRHRRPHMG